MLQATAHSRDWAVCLASCMISGISSIALTTLVTLFATSPLTQASIHHQALAAAILDILALTALLMFTLIQSWRSHRVLSWTRAQKGTIVVAVILPSVTASILSIYVLAWIHRNRPFVEQANAQWNVPHLMDAALAMWVLSVIAQTVFFTLCLKSSKPDTVIVSPGTGVYSVEAAYKESSPISMAVFSQPAFSRSAPDSPTFSNFTSSPIASVRNSMTHFLRPVTSKSRLISPRKDSYSKETAGIVSEMTSEPVRHEDGFETWEIDPQLDHPDPSSPTQGLGHSRLETIPGSRPVSPAHPLDGPFPSEAADPEDVPLPDSPPRPWVLELAGQQSPTSTPASPILKTFTPPFARRPSATSISNDQSHIHPLFRTDSPTPPPTASPGTILTASPWGGQIVDPEHPLSRGRGNSAFSSHTLMSRPSSPASSSRVVSRPGTPRANTSGVVTLELLRNQSHGDLKDALRSKTSLERVPTPPMPELAYLPDHRRQVSP